MKTFVAILMALISYSTFAGEGVGSRGGGEATSQAFAEQGWITYYQLSRAYPKNAPAIDLAKLKAAIETTKVDFVDLKLELNGIEKDAINDLDKKSITINRARYRSLSPAQQKKLNLHEYLRFTGADDSLYQISTPVILALEGDSFAAAEDSANLALTRLKDVNHASDKSLCYDLSRVEPLIVQTYKKMFESMLESEKAATPGKEVMHSLATHRLRVWQDKPMEFCKERKFTTTMGTLEKTTHARLDCYLGLIERDLKIALSDLRIYLKNHPTFDPSLDIWDKYNAKLESVCNRKVFSRRLEHDVQL